MDIRKEAYDSLDRYFTSLSVTGYRSYTEVYKLLVLSFIEELLYSFPGMVSENDYRLFSKVLENIYGTSCLIPYPDYKKVAERAMEENYRWCFSGNDTQRLTLNGLFRTTDDIMGIN